MTATDISLSLGGTHNFRDLGGVALPEGRQVRRGMIYRSCALRAAPEDWLAGLETRGPLRIIDLRSDAEVDADPGPMAAWPGRISVPLFAKLAPISAMLTDDPDLRLSDRYIAALEAAPDAFAEVLTAMAGATTGPVVFHCTAGKDRTGLVAALLLGSLGAAPEDIARDYAETTRFAPDLLRRLGDNARAKGIDPALAARILTSNEDDMLRVISYLEQRHGDAAGYLQAAGVPAACIARLRAQLIV
tara:strand:- start:7312 stop:8049 length:738 start_codon:yes stop_codon:yes gene_type:complete